ncbi:coiled-coil-helix-coiled-coil-helix domain containing 4b [Xyrauchen texanus]|uniref:coiled-coil-helix-coiled-coil-helix domain containing 4b n=1 Tax=Xyrauchen texanus TaxID=154827 RepID=UPI002242BC0A|nr:coiled-coil-helix-coiled-coil-helix domain containing 4b [Xyrauchen texanus]
MTALNKKGKDQVIFVTKEEHEIPSTIKLIKDDANEDHEEKGLILSSGEINWDCPCLGGMASGPCGERFKAAITCFHFSQEEVKGSDCLEQFMSMQECLRQHPELYPDEKEPDPHTANPEPNSQLKDSASISDFTLTSLQPKTLTQCQLSLMRCLHICP